uniref:hypothetical protein n=1 Tax=Massilia genomosp. 1 TaxID=2609280 RepID=UPI0035A2F593
MALPDQPSFAVRQIEGMARLVVEQHQQGDVAQLPGDAGQSGHADLQQREHRLALKLGQGFMRQADRAPEPGRQRVLRRTETASRGQ